MAAAAGARWGELSMARHIWTLLCRRAIIDRDSNTLSITDVIEDLRVQAEYAGAEPPPGLPTVPVSFTIVSLWERSNPEVPEERESYRIRIVDPDGKQLGENEQTFSMVGSHVRSRNALNIQGMPVRLPGRYEVQVFGRKGKKWQNVATVPLNVTIHVKPRAPNPSAS